jgi:hypothetical protein
MINLMHSYGQVRHVRAGISQAHARGRREPLARALTRELHEETGLVITAAHAGRLVWVQTVAFPVRRSTAMRSSAGKESTTLVASEGAPTTTDPSDR